MTTDYYLLGSLVERDDFFCISHLCQSKFLSNLWTYLCGITVNSLATAKDNVEISYFLDSLCECITCSERISATERAVCYDISLIGTTIESLTDNLSRLRQTHCHYRDNRTWELLLEAQCLLKSIQVIWIEDGWKSGTIDCTLWGHCIRTYIVSVRHLLCKYDNFQTHLIVLFSYYVIEYALVIDAHA